MQVSKSANQTIIRNIIESMASEDIEVLLVSATKSRTSQTWYVQDNISDITTECPDREHAESVAIRLYKSEIKRLGLKEYQS